MIHEESEIAGKQSHHHHIRKIRTGFFTSYYELFDRMTNNGRVFMEDLSSEYGFITTRTPTEELARTAYTEAIKSLFREYDKRGYMHPVATTQEEVLQQRIVATALAPMYAGRRSSREKLRGGGMYPQNIHAWTGFRESVEGYRIKDNDSMDESMDQIFVMSLRLAEMEASSESREQYSLLHNIEASLERAGIIHSIQEEKKISFCIMSTNDTISIVCVCKATHNLLLPMTAEECKNAYNNAFAHDAKTCDGSREWCNVVRPIGQLLHCMIEKKLRYGALTSGTRTYFVKIARKMKVDDAAEIQDCHIGREANCIEEDGFEVYISDAWCVGEANYLRAWAYVHTLHTSADPWKEPTTWMKDVTTDYDSFSNDWDQKLYLAKTDRKGTRNTSSQSIVYDAGNNFGAHNIKYYYPLHLGAICFVQIDDITIVDAFGIGRTACFKVTWNGADYAMKQFDMGKYGDMRFVREIAAYTLLQDVWGVLVPRPVFISESYTGGIMFLGLQQGRQPNSEDNIAEFYNVNEQIEREYGIKCNYAGRNMIIISDTDGAERVAAMDFEEWDDVSHTQLI